MYIVYDMKYAEQVVFYAETVDELAAFFNKSKNNIYSSISRGHKIKARYLIKKVEI